jgi:hypothetical protein
VRGAQSLAEHPWVGLNHLQDTATRGPLHYFANQCCGTRSERIQT